MGSRDNFRSGIHFKPSQIVPSSFFYTLVPRCLRGRFRLMFSSAWPIKQMF
jgi:hypothetical protein